MPVVNDCTEVILLKGAPSLDHFVMVLSSEQENKLFSFDQATEVAISLCSPALTLMFNFIILFVLYGTTFRGSFRNRDSAVMTQRKDF